MLHITSRVVVGKPKLEPLGGIVLAGGLSSRLGSSKALLPFGSETLLERVVRRLAQVVASVVVVGSRDQLLPPLPPAVTIVHDRQPGCGPLEGLRTGLEALKGRCEAAFLTGCDSPLLVPAFVHRLYELLGDYDVAAPQIKESIEPLAAIYRVRLLESIEELLAAGHAGPSQLVRRSSTRIVQADELRQVDPELETLFDVDQPEDYQFALERAGLAVHDAKALRDITRVQKSWRQ